MRPPSPRRFARLALALLPALAGCGAGDAEATWVPLARDYRAPDLVAQATAWEAEAGRTDTKIVAENQGVVLTRRIRPAEWRASEGLWSLTLSGGAWQRFARGTRLETNASPPVRAAPGPGALAPGEYRFAEGTLTLRPHPDQSAPPEGLLRARAENGRRVEGGWQVRLGTHCALGIPVWSGTSATLRFDVPAASELHFRFGFDAPSEGAELTLRVALDEEELLAEARTWRANATASFRVPLPPEPREDARLTLSLTGASGLGVFFTPLVAPRARGTPAERPWGTPRPDLVLVLVDTLRADALAAYGGDPALAPGLNAFAAQSRVFPRARANAAWTLPSVASLLTGVFPGQHGAVDEDLSLPHELPTIVEALSAAGYRTGAITDGNFVSAVHGLDQGFEWLSEHWPPDWNTWEPGREGHWSLRATLAEAREFLAADDGRPTFLLVHTYRVHEPYRLGEDEDPRANRALLARAKTIAGTDEPPADVGRAILMPFMPELRAQYFEGVRDLDRKLAPFLAELEAAGFFARGHLVLTSDHGEALGENDDFGHGLHLWEVKLRVPLLLRGPGLEPGEVPFTASLVDVAPTLAELAGIARDARWVGHSLTSLAQERPAFAWQLGAKSRQVALLAGTQKLITTPDEAPLRAGTCEEAFDLASDPGERRNLAREAGWPAELARRHVEDILAAQIGPRGTRLELSAERKQELQDLGYSGEDEDEAESAAPPR